MDFDYGKLFFLFVQHVSGTIIPSAAAIMVAYWPGKRPSRKVLFVVISTALFWGLPMVLYILALPAEFYLIYIEPALEDVGISTIPDFVMHIRSNLDFALIAVAAILSGAVPTYLRTRIWPKLYPPESTAS